MKEGLQSDRQNMRFKGSQIPFSFSAILFALLITIPTESAVQAQEVVFPLKISSNNRYLEDSAGHPFFYQAETPWGLFFRLNIVDIDDFLEIRKNQGFNTLQTMALPMDPATTDPDGNKPFEENDFSRPVPAYWNRILQGVKLAGCKGFLVGLAPAWKGCCGDDWNNLILENGLEKCRLYGQFLGNFFSGCDNLFWIQGGDSDPREHTDHYRQIALGIKETMPLALQTYHASSGHSSSDMIHYLDHSWMNFSWTYTYFPEKKNVWISILNFNDLPHVYQVNHLEYRKYHVKPFVLGEAQYEGEDSSSFSPLPPTAVIRRQAWWSLLSGACGHSYGSWNWYINPEWRRIIDDPGANQMIFIKSFTETIPWYQLLPCLEENSITSGGGTYGKGDFIVSAKTRLEDLRVWYFPPTGLESRTILFHCNGKTKRMEWSWYNPVNGRKFSASPVYGRGGKIEITSPGNNGGDSNDWILLLEKKSNEYKN